jgi:ACR3 family arsenite efflux pump ArsB
LLTVVLLFGFQGPVIIAQPLLIALLATPILIQSYGIFALAMPGPGAGNCRTRWPPPAR